MSRIRRIKKLKNMLQRLTNGQATEYFHLNMVRLPAKVANTPALGGRWMNFTVDFGLLNGCYQFPLYAPETEEIKEAEIWRDKDFKLFEFTVNNFVKYSTDPDLLPSIKVVKDILAPHQGAYRQEYQSETASMDDLVQKLERPENMPHVIKLGLEKILALLKAHNLLFQLRYAKRFDNRYAHKEEGTTTQAKLKALESFGLFCEAVTGLQLVANDDELENLNDIAALINATTDQYMIILHRHLGKKGSSGNNGDGEDGEDENGGSTDPEKPGEGGDGEGGETPGGGTHNPNITNPDIPPFIPDFE